MLVPLLCLQKFRPPPPTPRLPGRGRTELLPGRIFECLFSLPSTADEADEKRMRLEEAGGGNMAVAATGITPLMAADVGSGTTGAAYNYNTWYQVCWLESPAWAPGDGKCPKSAFCVAQNWWVEFQARLLPLLHELWRLQHLLKGNSSFVRFQNYSNYGYQNTWNYNQYYQQT